MRPAFMTILFARICRTSLTTNRAARRAAKQPGLRLEAMEDRLVPDAVAPGTSWNDGYYDQYGNLVGVTVTLNNSGPGWLDVSGGGGSVSVTPGAPPT